MTTKYGVGQVYDGMVQTVTTKKTIQKNQPFRA